MSIIEKLKDLIVQATTDKSHYYVKSVCEEAVLIIEQLQSTVDTQAKEIEELKQDGMKCRMAAFREIEDNTKLKQELAELQGKLDKAVKVIKLAHDNRDNIYEVSHILHRYVSELSTVSEVGNQGENEYKRYLCPLCGKDLWVEGAGFKDNIELVDLFCTGKCGFKSEPIIKSFFDSINTRD